MNAERRDSIRAHVGPEHTVRFLAKGHGYRNVRITNLSMGGCFATVLGADAPLFPPGALLEQFSFEHPSLPHGAFTARIAYALGGEGAEAMDFMGLGIRFLPLPQEVENGLRSFMEAILADPARRAQS